MLYRLQQFWLAISSRPQTEDLRPAAHILGDRLYALFGQMQPGEQAHSLKVLRRVQQHTSSKHDPLEHDLFVAALLHDCGKSRRPIKLWERVWIVLVKAILPARAKSWGQALTAIAQLPFWQQPLVVAEQHASWGAEMAARAGASDLSVRLIRCHQDKLPNQLNDIEKKLLTVLQAADNES